MGICKWCDKQAHSKAKRRTNFILILHVQDDFVLWCLRDMDIQPVLVPSSILLTAMHSAICLETLISAPSISLAIILEVFL